MTLARQSAPKGVGGCGCRGARTSGPPLYMIVSTVTRRGEHSRSRGGGIGRKGGVYHEMQRIAREFSPEAVACLIEIARDGTEDTRNRIIAMSMLLMREPGAGRGHSTPRKTARRHYKILRCKRRWRPRSSPRTSWMRSRPADRQRRYARQQAVLDLLTFCHALAGFHGGTPPSSARTWPTTAPGLRMRCGFR